MFFILKLYFYLQLIITMTD